LQVGTLATVPPHAGGRVEGSHCGTVVAPEGHGVLPQLQAPELKLPDESTAG
jgi:hypothetical protein